MGTVLGGCAPCRVVVAGHRGPPLLRSRVARPAVSGTTISWRFDHGRTSEQVRKPVAPAGLRTLRNASAHSHSAKGAVRFEGAIRRDGLLHKQIVLGGPDRGGGAIVDAELVEDIRDV